MQNNAFSIKKRLMSFVYAFNGIRLLFKTQHNAWIHGCATVFVVCLGFFVSLTIFEWIALTIAIGMVLAAEAFNTALETVCNQVCSEQNDNIKQTKDIAAGAVLLCACVALIIGLLVFVPKFL